MYRFLSLSVLVVSIGAAEKPRDRAQEILAGAEARIREHRTREVELRLLDPSGKPLPAGTRIEIEQTRHEFLFGCNIFALGRVRGPEGNETYARRFSDLFNYATLRFYWWNYELERGRLRYESTERILEFTKRAGNRPASATATC